MDNKDNTKEFKTFLEGLEQRDFNTLMTEFKAKEGYKEREDYLNRVSCKELNDILFNEDFIKIFCLDPQAKHIGEKLNFQDLDILGTLVYCYNSNAREFNKKVEEQRLKERLEGEGYLLGNATKDNKEDLKKLHGLKIKIVMDFTKTGIMGDFDVTAEREGSLFYSQGHDKLMFMPKRSRTRGHFIIGRFYYKEIKK